MAPSSSHNRIMIYGLKPDGTYVVGQMIQRGTTTTGTRRIGVVIDPISGEELQALAEKISATPAATAERAKQAMEYRAP